MDGKPQQGSSAQLPSWQKNNLSFLQNVPCFRLPPETRKCRACVDIRDPECEDAENVCCRFIEFRKLKYTTIGKVIVFGFSSAATDATDADDRLWLPDVENPPSDLDLETSLFLLEQVGDHFCSLLEEEKQAHKVNKSVYKTVFWKRFVHGVREMCDVCSTTIFNFHWSCSRCGFVVCLDCYKGCRSVPQNPSISAPEESEWLQCVPCGLHRRGQLMMTEIIPEKNLHLIGKRFHETRDLWTIDKFCGCPDSEEGGIYNPETREAVKCALAKRKTALQSSSSEEDFWSDEEDDALHLRRTLLGPVPATSKNKHQGPVLLRNERPNKKQGPIRIMTQMVSTLVNPDIPHSWLCVGKLLRLTDPVCEDNLKMFQEQWERGQPVMVSNVSKLLNEDLWSPKSLARDFGKERINLINCESGRTVPHQPMRRFWDGFENPFKRLKDFDGVPMLLKVKDWPPSEDFAETLPTRFEDLMQALPLQDYTKRNGKLNLTTRLPDCFVRPDLGPKMYNAYGKPLPVNKATTNLHLDVSDAVNVMVYVGISHDGNIDKHYQDTLAAIDEAGCDFLAKRRVLDNGELPGALWHIYEARDADKIRDLLNKVTIELGGRLEPDNDPIHDQSAYLDGSLRYRLYKDYGVQGYAILQCEGDAVFIPAGAPHQVRNLNNCIKVAEDFVSPENVVHCSHLTQQFRELSNSHSNHEDKLQIKNIIYHTVKDAMCALAAFGNKELKRTNLLGVLHIPVGYVLCGSPQSVTETDLIHHCNISGESSNPTQKAVLTEICELSSKRSAFTSSFRRGVKLVEIPEHDKLEDLAIN
ncbi:unnamed protein product [Ceutorhynchus assimilis]|uniref:[histone H3]-dimethyl-L-lysine(9) demethylase n=1 Tax=Ceutorhynchus assimilis TaxID=467358 RepID=A0A9N9M989_9CUCU|nr:unnamed protein product [Ceutorhynchus assimilis]